MVPHIPPPFFLGGVGGGEGGLEESSLIVFPVHVQHVENSSIHQEVKEILLMVTCTLLSVALRQFTAVHLLQLTTSCSAVL